MTSAPSRASTWAQRGPAWWRPKSITRMPFKGPLPSVIASLLAPSRDGAADRPECNSSSTAPGVNLVLRPRHQQSVGRRVRISLHTLDSRDWIYFVIFSHLYSYIHR